MTSIVGEIEENLNLGQNGRLHLRVSICLSSFHAIVTSTGFKACGKESILLLFGLIQVQITS